MLANCYPAAFCDLDNGVDCIERDSGIVEKAWLGKDCSDLGKHSIDSVAADPHGFPALNRGAIVAVNRKAQSILRNFAPCGRAPCPERAVCAHNATTNS